MQIERPKANAAIPALHEPRNPGLPLDMDWVRRVQANTSAIERRAATLPGRRSVKKDWQAAWLLKAISLIDLTTLAGDDTEGRVRRLCAKAKQPVSPEILDRLGMTGLTVGAVCVYHDMVPAAVAALRGTQIPVAAVSTGFPAGDDTEGRVRRLCAKAKQPVSPDILDRLGMTGLTVGAVCVYHDMVPAAVAALRGTQIPVAAVSTGFPAGLSPFHLRIAEIGESVAAGAKEIDIVISRRHVLSGNWQALYDEMREMRAACGDAHVKAILATGELGTLRNVARASLVCMMGGADFIKTSTGKEGVNATLPVTLTMIRAIRDYHEATGIRVGYKPAGGLSKAKDALTYLSMMKDELGDRWLQPDLFRFGASSLLGDIERQLEHHVTGAYSASWRHALA